MAAQHHNKLNSCDLGSYCVLWMSSSYVCIFVKLYQRQSLEWQHGCSGQCRSSWPVVCISAPLTARVATRQNTEHTCMNHSQAHQIKRQFTPFTKTINMLCFSLSISHMTQYKIKVFILFNYTISLIVHTYWLCVFVMCSFFANDTP